eukprot:CAMPEP_0202860796 /NCGR_PEP_ID=MMETSP1391-20130828/2398_1 /ASSEMBLY_ACC=CAM_ASM_000867 /TAXON_ID=1034604 /ORGANISM="Chlamydomonas leiostraca, Strain SAG 11-49" /LENGTH=134 /DNA_ID=CAMNT_0049540051 /DNA_START=373 /DNA_END=777 /DNA_ORIENTATION=+
MCRILSASCAPTRPPASGTARSLNPSLLAPFTAAAAWAVGCLALLGSAVGGAAWMVAGGCGPCLTMASSTGPMLTAPSCCNDSSTLAGDVPEPGSTDFRMDNDTARAFAQLQVGEGVPARSPPSTFATAVCMAV